MSKIDISDVSSGYNRTKINSNFQKIEDALNNNVLFRDNPTGEANQMKQDLDMNSLNINNLAAATDGQQAVNLKQMEDYILLNSSNIVANFREFFVATAGQTVVNLVKYTYTPGGNNMSLYINGVRQVQDSYVQSGATSITLSEPLEGGENIEVTIGELSLEGTVPEAVSVAIVDAYSAIDVANANSVIATEAAASATLSAESATASELSASINAAIALNSAAEALASEAQAQATVDSLVAGSLGFDADVYDFGFITTTAFITRDYGVLL